MSSEAITKNDLSSIFDGIGMKAYNTGDMRKLLWTNPSPTSDFAARTVEVDLSDYDAVDVVFKNYKTSNPGRMIRCKKGGDALNIQNAGDGTNSRWRYFVAKSDNTGVQFYDGYYGSTVNNAYSVPYQIYGIKLGTGYRQNELLITDAELDALEAALGI